MTLIRGNIRGHRASRQAGVSTGSSLLSDAWAQLRRDLSRKGPKKLRTEDHQRHHTPLTHRAAAVLAVLTDEPQMARQIAPEVELTTAQANTAILQLSARGLATRTSAGWVRS